MCAPTRNIPRTGGSYVLWLRLGRKRRLHIGRLGEQLLLPGWYAYCGSAFGPGGLRARLGHHLRVSDRPRWHVDYLKTVARIRSIWFSVHPLNLEHNWARALSSLPDAVIPVSRFGSSDCDCAAHLVRCPHPPDPACLADGPTGIRVEAVHVP